MTKQYDNLNTLDRKCVRSCNVTSPPTHALETEADVFHFISLFIVDFEAVAHKI